MQHALYLGHVHTSWKISGFVSSLQKPQDDRPEVCISGKFAEAANSLSLRSPH